jgi:general secretion pathway protein E family protein
MTIEDPIEYKIDGINQIEVNPNTGLTFEKGLKAILRMDPDKVMIGEIRNEDTAHIAISSSITGHLVLSTLHTESSPASIGRLIDMGIEPYLISAGLIGVISQRLIRKLCPHCKEKIKNTNPLVNSKYVYRASGCEKCNSGYSGRIAVFEIMIVDSEIRQMITNRESVAKIKEVSIKKGMNTLSHEILNLIENGETTFEEFYKNVHTVGEL